MRIGVLPPIAIVLVALPSAAQDPPLPAPVLPAKTDTAPLRAALRIPIDPPDYRFRFDDSGRFDILDRSAEAASQIARIRTQLKKNASDAERYDELRLWHHRCGDLEAVKDCALRAARCYRDRLRADPYNADLLARCGEALIEAGEFSDADQQLRKATAVDPNNWRAWYLLARVHIDNAYALQALPAPLMAEEPNLTTPPLGPRPRTLPAELRVDLPPVSETLPPPQSIKPAGFSMPTRVVDWAEVGKLSNEAASCLKEAVALAPHEPVVRFARCCQRKLEAEVLFMTDGAAGPVDPFTDPDNIADSRAAVTAETDSPEVISVATWFEISAATRRLEHADDENFRRQTYSLVCDRIEQLEAIAGKSNGPKGARAALLAAHLCRKIGQPFRAGVLVRFAVTADPDSRPAWEAFLATLAESGPPSEYVAAARKAAERFDSPTFILRWADAAARAGEPAEALHILEQLEQREPANVSARLAEATVHLQTEGVAALPHVNDLLDAAERTLRAQPHLPEQIDCELLRACAQLIGGNAALGRVMLEDLARREPFHPRVKAALKAIAE